MLVNCPISCDSCPEPLDLSTEQEDLLDAVAKYGKPQRVEVSIVFMIHDHSDRRTFCFSCCNSLMTSILRVCAFDSYWGAGNRFRKDFRGD